MKLLIFQIQIFCLFNYWISCYSYFSNSNYIFRNQRIWKFTEAEKLKNLKSKNNENDLDTQNLSDLQQRLEDLIEKDPKLKEFLAGPEGKPWKGSKDILERRNQIPLAEYLPNDVIRICLEALKSNDDPQLDHGACVTLAFQSPSGVLANGGLDPAAYGRFLRSTDYEALLDFYKYEFIDGNIVIGDNSIIQKVNILKWDNQGSQNFDFYLSKVNEKWLIDIILISK